MRWAYRRADYVVAVSEGVATDLERRASLKRGSVRVIHNPVVDARLTNLADADAEHPWLADDGPPVVLAVGRLAAVKDYTTLLHAFAMLRRHRPVRLIIYGEGPLRTDLERLRERLGLPDCVALPGFTANPYAAMRRAAVLTLSSRYEGLPNVLIEALACGCPVVATDCPSGPAEILDHGRFGRLVKPGDAEGLCRAIETTLDEKPSSQRLRARGDEFSVAKAAQAYLDLIESRSVAKRKERRCG
jgi:glycosyltransferase involved in cell wall biosynthesis